MHAHVPRGGRGGGTFLQRQTEPARPVASHWLPTAGHPHPGTSPEVPRPSPAAPPPVHTAPHTPPGPACPGPGPPPAGVAAALAGPPHAAAAPRPEGPRGCAAGNTVFGVLGPVYCDGQKMRCAIGQVLVAAYQKYAAWEHGLPNVCHSCTFSCYVLLPVVSPKSSSQKKDGNINPPSAVRE